MPRTYSGWSQVAGRGRFPPPSTLRRVAPNARMWAPIGPAPGTRRPRVRLAALLCISVGLLRAESRDVQTKGDQPNRHRVRGDSLHHPLTDAKGLVRSETHSCGQGQAAEESN